MTKNFEELLTLLKGEQFIQILEEHSFDANNLKYLNKTCLDDIIPKNLYGPRLEFEYHLKKWQEDQGIITNINTKEVQNQSVKEIYSNSTNFSQIGYGEISIDNILKSSFNGKQILLYFQKNKNLNPTYRKLISSCVVEYLIDNKISSTPKTFERIACQIVDFFPTENKDIYFIPIKGRKPAGYLYSKYHNSISKLKKEGVYESSFETQDIEESISCLQDSSQDENQISSKDWLKYNVEPLDIVMQKWEETFSLRTKYIKENHSLLEILEEWPLLKQAFGYKLIIADFSLQYPDKVNLIFEKWEGFCNPILELIQAQVKSSECLELIKDLKGSQNNFELRNIIIVHLLHALLKPNSRKCVINEINRKRKFIKTTIEDSRNSFLLWAPTLIELNTKIKLLIDDTYSKKQTLQPIICSIGKSLFKLDEFYVFYGNVFYKLPNLITCIDVAFKIFFVLTLKYPEDCKNVWLFFQQHFYNIDVKSTEKSTVLVSVLNDIKAAK